MLVEWLPSQPFYSLVNQVAVVTSEGYDTLSASLTPEHFSSLRSEVQVENDAIILGREALFSDCSSCDMKFKFSSPTNGIVVIEGTEEGRSWFGNKSETWRMVFTDSELRTSFNGKDENVVACCNPLKKLALSFDERFTIRIVVDLELKKDRRCDLAFCLLRMTTGLRFEYEALA